MKLPRNYFENLSPTKYRAYLKLLPNMKKDSTRIISMLILTFVGSSILGFFAINPTLSTITQLSKQLKDSKFVYQQLKTKINNITSLQNEYDLLSNDLPVVFDTIPKNALAPTLVGQIETLASEKNVAINAFRVNKAQLSKIEQVDNTAPSYTFSLEAEGAYDQVTDFISALASFNRIVTIESISLNKDPRNDALILSLRGRGYFKQ